MITGHRDGSVDPIPVTLLQISARTGCASKLIRSLARGGYFGPPLDDEEIRGQLCYDQHTAFDCLRRNQFTDGRNMTRHKNPNNSQHPDVARFDHRGQELVDKTSIKRILSCTQSVLDRWRAGRGVSQPFPEPSLIEGFKHPVWHKRTVVEWAMNTTDGGEVILDVAMGKKIMAVLAAPVDPLNVPGANLRKENTLPMLGLAIAQGCRTRPDLWFTMKTKDLKRLLPSTCGRVVRGESACDDIEWCTAISDRKFEKLMEQYDAGHESAQV